MCQFVSICIGYLVARFHISAQSGCSATGDRDAALQLAAKGKEHAQLAKEARQAANQAAFEGFNLHVTNRFKVVPFS